MIVWLNGALTPLEDAAISPLDHGLVVGDGVFETIRVYRGQPFAWTRHVKRLHASADGIGLTAPPFEELREARVARPCRRRSWSWRSSSSRPLRSPR